MDGWEEKSKIWNLLERKLHNFIKLKKINIKFLLNLLLFSKLRGIMYNTYLCFLNDREKFRKAKYRKMKKIANKKATRRVGLKLLVSAITLTMALLMVFSAFPLNSAAEQIFRKNDSIYSDYKQFLDGSAVFKLPDTIKDDDIISVIVELPTNTLMSAYNSSAKTMSFNEFLTTRKAEKIKDEIRDQKDSYLELLREQGIEHTAGADYANIFSGFEVLMKAKDFDFATSQLPNGCFAMVGEVYNTAETKLVENKVSIYENTGIFDSSEFAYDGSGMVVAVLDTGLDYTHPAFSVNNFKPTGELGLTKDYVSEHISNTAAAVRVPGLTADDVYLNDKVPFSFDYADNDADVYSMHNNHGTHVSGVIVGKDDTITGVAPNAQLVSMKIFSDTLESARASWILSALEDCVELGVDVINMSLGTACGFSREIDNMKMAEVYDEIRELGISLVVAASNSFASSYGSEKNGNLGLTSNPDTGTVGSPSTYPAAFSIASIDGTKTPYILDKDESIIYYLESTDSAGEEKVFFDDLLGTSTDVLELEYVLVPGVGNPSDYNGIDVAGKIALVRRGSNTFEEKAKAAEAAGAKALIVYNNTSGDIRMNVGIVSIPVCSISQDDGEKLADAGSGTIKVSHAQTSGPFMSDFSSWGPTPTLGIKPEITAHGGNILSAVTGHGYDRLSGTSMACPNMSGVVALMRQYVINEMPKGMFEDENGYIDYVEVNAIVNRLLMSTADIIYNKNGLPYAVRKQGAGLANLAEAGSTSAYLLTYDKDGKVMDKSKVELGDDPSKTGVYTFKFTIDNFGSTTLSYDLSASVMTEGVSETPTYSGETVVTQEGYLLSGAHFEIISANGGTQNGNTVTVNGNSKCDVEVKITLSDADKKYLNDSFENGMYVEGFVSLTAKEESSTDLVLPYLAFYGDWTEAPLFDLDYFETNADELNDAIETLDKTLPDAYATRPVGGLEDDYISYLGSYYFRQDPKNKIISANRDYVAISNTDGTVNSLRFVWGGQLRNAEKIVITITDRATGEVVFEKTEVSVRKSYGDGGSYIYPTNIEIEFGAAENNLKNNSCYDVKLVGYLEYGDGGIETNEKNTFEFPLYVDFEAPTLSGCEFYTEYDKQAKKTRLFVKMAVYDNHYSMAMQVGYVGLGTIDGEMTNILKPFNQYITPIYATQKNATTYVTYELTDHIFDIKNEITGSSNPNTFAVTFYDYAMNDATYEVELPDDFLDFYLEETEITLNTYETYTLSANVYPEREWDELLEFTSSNEDLVRIVNNKIVAMPVTDEDVASGNNTALVFIYDKQTKKEAVLTVNVVNEKRITKPVADVFELTGYDTTFAFYIMSNEDRDIGETGDMNLFNSSSYNLALYPNEKIKLNYKLDAYFPEDITVEFISGNENIIKVDQNGNVEALSEGYTSITVRVLQDGKPTLQSKTVSVEVKDPYVRTGPTLNNYYGAGVMNNGKVNIPEDMLFTTIGQYAFSNYNYVPKDLAAGDIISEEEPDKTKIAYIGNNFIKEVIIPEGVETIGPYAFAGLTALEKVVLPSTLEAIEYGAFFGCTSLTTVEGLENVKLINKYAFQNCDIKNDLSLNNIHAIGDYAFAGNTNLKSIAFSETLSSIGAYAFMGNLKLTSFDVSKCGNIKYGPYVFLDCKALEEITINSSVIPNGAFYGCEKLTTLHIGKDVSTIGEYAISGTNISTFSVAEGNTTYYPTTNKEYLLSSDGKTLLMVAPKARGEFKLSGVTRVGYGAFAGNKLITKVVMPDVVRIDAYAFSECRALSEVSFGQLKSVGDYAFLLTNIKILPKLSATLDKIGEYAFAFTLIEEVNIADGINVGNYAFAECTKLHTVTVGNNVVLGEGVFMRHYDRSDPRNNNETFLNRKISKIEVTEGSKTYTFYYEEYLSELKSITIGNNVQIGSAAFLGAAKAESVKLGSGAVIGEMAFYNCAELKSIDLSMAKSIGKLAFSGDTRYLYSDSSASSYAMGDRLYFYSCQLKNVDLSSLGADGLGEQVFAYNQTIESVKLGNALESIPYMAFFKCVRLADINLASIKNVGDEAFNGCTALTAVELGSAQQIGKYAFGGCTALTDVKLSANGAKLLEGAFFDAAKLNNVTNIDKLTEIGAYAFAYTDIRGAHLTNALKVGDLAFAKDELTDYVFDLVLGEKLEALGDNPFAFCRLPAMYKTEAIMFNGNKVGEKIVYTFDINENIKVINGSLYAKVPNGTELVTYIGLDENSKSLDRKNVVIADGTVKISALAFAGTDVVRVTLPYSMKTVGHKAFYACDKLTTVTFKGYIAPSLEEEFDQSYYDSFENLPCTGTYEMLRYEDLNGNGIIEPNEEIPVDCKGIEIVPFYMWNIASNKYNNIYYGANFVDYIGHTTESNRSYDNMGELVMIAPSNGVGYNSFIFAQYFSDLVAGDVAPDALTLAAIEAIDRLPEVVTLEDKALVVAARNAYDLVTSTLQKALVTNYDKLRRAETLIEAYEGALNPEGPSNDTDDPSGGETDTEELPAETPADINWLVIAAVAEAVAVIALAIALVIVLAKKKGGKKADAGKVKAEDDSAKAEAEPAQSAEAEDEAKEEAEITAENVPEDENEAGADEADEKEASDEEENI